MTEIYWNTNKPGRQVFALEPFIARNSAIMSGAAHEGLTGPGVGINLNLYDKDQSTASGPRFS